MAKVSVNAGICGFITDIEVEKVSRNQVAVTIHKTCPNYINMDQELKDIDPYKEGFAKIGSGQVYEVARKYAKHASCPVPSGIIKAIEVAAKLALPKTAEILIEKDKQ